MIFGEQSGQAMQPGETTRPIAADLLTELLGCIAAILCYKDSEACRCRRQMEGAAWKGAVDGKRQDLTPAFGFGPCIRLYLGMVFRTLKHHRHAITDGIITKLRAIASRSESSISR